jgi:hypothetical protein
LTTNAPSLSYMGVRLPSLMDDSEGASPKNLVLVHKPTAKRSGAP